MPQEGLRKHTTVLFSRRRSDSQPSFGGELFNHRNLTTHQICITSRDVLASGSYAVSIIPDKDTASRPVDTGIRIDLTGKDSGIAYLTGVIRGVVLTPDDPLTEVSAAENTVSAVISSFSNLRRSYVREDERQKFDYVSTDLGEQLSGFWNFSRRTKNHRNMVYHQIMLASDTPLNDVYQLRIIPDSDDIALDGSVALEEQVNFNGNSSVLVLFGGVIEGIHLQAVGVPTVGAKIQITLSSSVERFGELSYPETEPVDAVTLEGFPSEYYLNRDNHFGLNDADTLGGLPPSSFLNVPETDPIFTASPAFSITGTQITNWDTAFGWGDHSVEGYLLSVDISDINASGTPDATTYLRGDGTWATPAGGGGGGIPEAPEDGTPYVRQDAGWESETREVRVFEGTDINNPPAGMIVGDILLVSGVELLAPTNLAGTLNGDGSYSMTWTNNSTGESAVRVEENTPSDVFDGLAGSYENYAADANARTPTSWQTLDGTGALQLISGSFGSDPALVGPGGVADGRNMGSLDRFSIGTARSFGDLAIGGVNRFNPANDSYAFSGFFAVRSFTGSDVDIINVDNPSAANSGAFRLTLRANGDLSLLFGLWSGSAYPINEIIHSGINTVDEWVHVALSWDQPTRTMTAWIDGVQVLSKQPDFTGYENITRCRLQVNARINGTRASDTAWVQPYLFLETLTQADADTLYNGGSGVYSAEGAPGEWQTLIDLAADSEAYTVPAPAVGDPLWDDVTLLITGDGADEGSTITDEKGASVTVSGTPVTDTDNTPFAGESSIRFDNVGGPDYLEIAWDDTKYNVIDGGQWTIDAWVYADSWTSWDSSFNNVPSMIGKQDPLSNTQVWSFGVNDGKVEFYHFNGAQQRLSDPGSISTGQWHHIAVEIDGDEGYIYANGTLVNSNLALGLNEQVATENLVLMRGYAEAALGHLRDIRITKGLRYGKTSYTPPTAPAPTGALQSLVGNQYRVRDLDGTTEGPVSDVLTVEEVIFPTDNLVSYLDLTDPSTMERSGAPIAGAEGNDVDRLIDAGGRISEWTAVGSGSLPTFTLDAGNGHAGLDIGTDAALAADAGILDPPVSSGTGSRMTAYIVVTQGGGGRRTLLATNFDTRDSVLALWPGLAGQNHIHTSSSGVSYTNHSGSIDVSGQTAVLAVSVTDREIEYYVNGTDGLTGGGPVTGVNRGFVTTFAGARPGIGVARLATDVWYGWDTIPAAVIHEMAIYDEAHSIATMTDISAALQNKYAEEEGLPPLAGNVICHLDMTDNSRMWQDSAKTTPVTASGDPVGYIEDASGNGNDWQQPSSSNRPLWRGNYLEFTTAQWLDGPDLSAVTAGSLAMHVQTLTNSQGAWFHFNSLESSTELVSHWDAFGGLYNSFGSSQRSSPAAAWPLNGAASSDRMSFVTTHDGTDQETFVNDASVGTYTITGDNLGDQPRLGTAWHSGGDTIYSIADGRLYEVLIYDTAVDLATAQAIDTYFAPQAGDTVFQHDLTASPSVTLANYSPEVGPPWNPSTGVVTATGWQGSSTGFTGTLSADNDVGVSDFTVEWNMIDGLVTSNGSVSLMLRHDGVGDGADDGFYVGFYNGALELYRRDGGVWTLLDTHATTIVKGVSYSLRAVFSGTSIEVYLDGEATPGMTATDSAHQTNTGIRMRHNYGFSGGVDSRISNIVVTL